MRKKKVIILLMTSLILAGCGDNNQAIQKEQIETNQIMSEQDETSDKITLSDQILDQSFEVTLDGWGKVTFASYTPVENEYMNGDVRFKLLKGSEEIYSFTGVSEDNCRFNQTFRKIIAVAFKDYNRDGKKDIIIINEYAPQSSSNIDEGYNEVRLYTQTAGEKEFSLDSSLNEYLMKNYNNDSISSVMEGIEDYYANYYDICTSKSKLEVETFARKAKTSILNGDWTAFATMISYPITIRGVEYADAESLAFADIVLSQDYISALSKAECENLFANWQGIMLGNGELWIGEILNGNMESEGLKILAINDANES